MDSVSEEQVIKYRLQINHLKKRAPRNSLVNVVGDICGVHAQLPSSAEMALWTRVKGLVKEDIAQALWRDRILVKTWCMRGTSHLLMSTDIPIFVGGLLRHSLHRERSWIRKYGITNDEIEDMVRTIVDVLDDDVLTRKELTKRVVATMGEKARPWIAHSWGGAIKLACLRGDVVFGPSQGQEVTFVKQRTWLPRIMDLSTEEAENLLLLRYLHSYGPAEITDFAYWAGMTVSDARSIKERVVDEILNIEVSGKIRLLLHKDLREIKKQRADGFNEEDVRLLPSFDVYMLAHKDKSDLVDKRFYKLVYRKAGWLSPVILVNGKAIGVWTHKRKGEHLHLKIEPFNKISKNKKRQIDAESDRLAHFYNTKYKVIYPI